MVHINYQITPKDLQDRLDTFWQLSGEKIRLIDFADSCISPKIYTDNYNWHSVLTANANRPFWIHFYFNGYF